MVFPSLCNFAPAGCVDRAAVLGRSRSLIDCLVSRNYADCTADNYKSVNTLSKNRRFFSPLQMRRERRFRAADFLAPGGCAKLLRLDKVRTTHMPNAPCSCSALVVPLTQEWAGIRGHAADCIQPCNLAHSPDDADFD